MDRVSTAIIPHNAAIAAQAQIWSSVDFVVEFHGDGSLIRATACIVKLIPPRQVCDGGRANSILLGRLGKSCGIAALLFPLGKRHATAAASALSWCQCGMALVTGMKIGYDSAASVGRFQPFSAVFQPFSATFSHVGHP